MILYHYTDRANRAQIARGGLLPATELGIADESEIGGDAEYVWLDERGPEYRAPHLDVWAVEIDPAHLERCDGDGGEPWFRTEYVLPSALTLYPPPIQR